MSKMPEALLMAGRLLEAERYTQGARVATQVDAAAELRRQHSVNAELLEALQLALSAHGRMLMSDPPQDAWKAQGVEEKARAAIRAAIAKAEEVKP